VHERQRTKSHQNNKDPFEEFEHGNGLEDTALTAMWVWRGGGLTHAADEDSRQSITAEKYMQGFPALSGSPKFVLTSVTGGDSGTMSG
jgi:hypothetical protein